MDKESQRLNEYNRNAKFKIGIVSVADLEFLNKNARYMSNDTFKNLVNNIKEDGELSQIPFCVKTINGKYKVLSGNHRGKAAIEAGITEIPIIYTEENLNRSKEVAIQLSHNAINGKDDMIILKELYNEIQDLDLKYYAGLDDKTLEQLEKISMESFKEAQLDYRLLSFLFLPEEIESLKNTFEKIKDILIDDEVVLTKLNDFDKFLETQSKIQTSYNIHNGATSLMLLLDIFEKHQEDLKDGWLDENGETLHNEFVPVSSIFGTDNIPTHSAVIINKVVDKMLASGDVTKKNKWQVMEYLAAEYLAGD